MKLNTAQLIASAHTAILALCTGFACSTCPPALAVPLTRNEKQVTPYLIADVKRYDRWPGPTGWQLFGMTESELKAKYGPSSYTRTKKGGRLHFNYGAATSDYDLTYTNNKVSSFTNRVTELCSNHLTSKTVTDRATALQDALSAANTEVDNDTKNTTGNIGFLWYAYRERARIYRAMGKEMEALQDIKAAEAVEQQILKDPQKALKDNRPVT